MPTINGILYFRKQVIARQYPELVEGPGKDYYIYNMDRNPKSETYGQEKIDWNTKVYPQPTEEEMISWYNEFKHLELRKYDEIGEQLDRLTHDIENGLFGESAMGGEFYLLNKAVKDSSKKSSDS